jgi:hypothetical protein
MFRQTIALAVVSAGLFLLLPEAGAGGHRIGAGARYWQAIEDIDVDNVDEQGFSWLITYQYKPALLMKLELDVEFFPEDFAGSESDVIAPQASVIFGAALYAGIGAGVYYSDGDFSEDLFYSLRAGFDFELLPSIYLDLNANYRFEQWGDLRDVAENIDTDTVTLGAALRMEL